MIAIGGVVYLVILWSLTGPALVSGQCTTVGCGALDGDGNNNFIFSEVEELKLELQQATAALGTFFKTNSVNYFDFLYICCTTNPQQHVEAMEFGL